MRTRLGKGSKNQNETEPSQRQAELGPAFEIQQWTKKNTLQKRIILLY
jgi:hypothetical protein